MAAAEMTADGAGAAQKKGGKKLLLIIVILVLLLAAGGGAAAWFLLKPKEGAGREEEKPTPSVFLPLEQFTVNLADRGGERFAQVAMTLEVKDQKTEEELKQKMPVVRNGVLLLLSSKSSTELLTVEGKEKLADEVAVIGGRALGWRPPRATTRQSAEERADQERADDERAADEDEEYDRPRRRPNPVRKVHFSHFIVQ